MSGENHARKAAALRGERRFTEAIAEIEDNLSALDDNAMVPGLLQAFYAAKEAGMEGKAQLLARQIGAIDPELPSIKDYL